MDHDLPKDHDLPNRPWPRDEFARDNQWRRELDEASPSLGSAGVIIGAIVLIILGIVYFSPPAGNDTTSVVSRDPIETPAPTMPPNNQ